jgi:hypothetical protein
MTSGIRGTHGVNIRSALTNGKSSHATLIVLFRRTGRTLGVPPSQGEDCY